jgi:hypothetical protein
MRGSLFLATGAAVAASIIAFGCSNTATRFRERASAAAALDPATRGKIEQGMVEPGFTPEMVYLALGRPSSPSGVNIDSTRDGTWTYRDFHRNERDFVEAGFRRRVVFDPVRKSDVIITEPVDPRLYPHLRAHTLEVEFRDGRVSDVRRRAL